MVELLPSGSPYNITQTIVIDHDLVIATSGMTDPTTASHPAVAIVVDWTDWWSTASMRAFAVDRGISLSLHGLAIRRGSAIMGSGGGIYTNGGNVTLVGCEVSGSYAASGGGLAVGGGSLTLVNTAVLDNEGAYEGGGIFAWSGTNVTILGSNISGNSAFAYSGGIGIAASQWEDGNGYAVVITDTLIARNSVMLGGGGVHTSSANGTGTVRMLRVTISGNSARNGGGILAYGNMEITDSLIVGNRANLGGGIYYDVQGGQISGVNCLSNVNVHDQNNNQELSVSGTSIVDNVGLPAGVFAYQMLPIILNYSAAGVYNRGALHLLNASLIDGNSYEGDSATANLYNGGEIYLYFPAPAGRFIANSFLCQELECVSHVSDTSMSCPTQRCNYAKYGGRHMTMLDPGRTSAPVPSPCRAGVVGSADPAFQQTAECGGPCPAGYTCPSPATLVPVPVPPGYFSLEGAVSRSNCSIESFYCPARSVRPSVVSPGFMSVNGPPTNREAQAMCPDGCWCSGGVARACHTGTYSNVTGTPEERGSRLSCLTCPLFSSSPPTATGPYKCGASSATECQCLIGYFDTMAGTNSEPLCKPCPRGMVCTNGTRLSTLAVQPSWWRPAANFADAGRCLVHAACTGGELTSPSSTCGSGLAGPYCAQCEELGSYFDEAAAQCRVCAGGGSWAVVALLLITIAALALSPRFRHNLATLRVCADASGKFKCLPWWQKQGAQFRRVLAALRHADWPIKLKIGVSFYQVITQIGNVYAVPFPPAYANYLEHFQIVNLKFGFLGNLSLSCLLPSLAARLAVEAFTPLALVVVVLLAAWAHSGRASVLEVLPAVMWLTFLLLPSVTSRQFSILAPCLCLHSIDHSQSFCNPPAYQYMKCGGVEHNEARTVAVVALALWAVALPLTYAALLWAARRAIIHRRATPLSRALRFLHGEYRPGCYFYELFAVARKLVLTGAIALLPGTLLPLVVAVIASAMFLVIESFNRPHLSLGNNLIATASCFMTCLVFLSALWIKTAAEVGESTDTDGLNGNSLDTHVDFVVPPSALLAMLFSIVGMLAAVLLIGFINAVPREVRWQSDHTRAEARQLQSASASHAFISHTWSSGQDQARSLKLLLTELTSAGSEPLRVWLDLDDLVSIGALESCVEQADLLIVFLSGSYDDSGIPRSDYYRSHNSLRELRHALKKDEGRRVLYLLETDRIHGGVALDVHVADAPADVRPHLEAQITSGAIVRWYRSRSFLDVSLTLVLQAVLRAGYAQSGARARRANDHLMTVGSGSLPKLLSPLTPGGFHLFVSPLNADARGFADELAAIAPRGQPLLVTEDPAMLPASTCWLLYLNKHTFAGGQEAASASAAASIELEEALLRALQGGRVRVLLVWEQRSEQHGSPDFGSIIRVTPASLRAEGLYDELALPVLPADHCRRSLELIFNAVTSLTARGRAVGVLAAVQSWWARTRSAKPRPAVRDLRRHMSTMLGKPSATCIWRQLADPPPQKEVQVQMGGVVPPLEGGREEDTGLSKARPRTTASEKARPSVGQSLRKSRGPSLSRDRGDEVHHKI